MGDRNIAVYMHFLDYDLVESNFSCVIRLTFPRPYVVFSNGVRGLPSSFPTHRPLGDKALLVWPKFLWEYLPMPGFGGRLAANRSYR